MSDKNPISLIQKFISDYLNREINTDDPELSLDIIYTPLNPLNPVSREKIPKSLRGVKLKGKEEDDDVKVEAILVVGVSKEGVKELPKNSRSLAEASTSCESKAKESTKKNDPSVKYLSHDDFKIRVTGILEDDCESTGVKKADFTVMHVLQYVPRKKNKKRKIEDGDIIPLNEDELMSLEDSSRPASITTTSQNRSDSLDILNPLLFPNTMSIEPNPFDNGVEEGENNNTTINEGNLHVIGWLRAAKFVSQNPLSVSDARCKNIHEEVVEEVLEKFIQLQPRYYSWKNDDENKKIIGLISQETEKIFPGIVSDVDSGGTCTPVKAIDNMQLNTVIIKAIQELYKNVGDIKNDVARKSNQYAFILQEALKLTMSMKQRDDVVAPAGGARNSRNFRYISKAMNQMVEGMKANNSLDNDGSSLNNTASLNFTKNEIEKIFDRLHSQSGDSRDNMLKFIMGKLSNESDGLSLFTLNSLAQKVIDHPEMTSNGMPRALDSSFMKKVKHYIKERKSTATNNKNGSSNLELKDYQNEALNEIRRGENVVIISPTGTGKTYIAIGWMKEVLLKNTTTITSSAADHNNMKFLFVVETQVLAIQQFNKFRDYFPQKQVKLLYSDNTINNSDWEELIEDDCDVKIIVLTAGFLLSKLLALPDEEHQAVALSKHTFHGVFFDECHHTSKKHPYLKILNLTKAGFSESCQRIGLTATPTSGSSNDIYKENLDRFLADFGNANLYIVPLERPKHEENNRSITLRPVDINFDKLMEKLLWDLYSSISPDKKSGDFNMIKGEKRVKEVSQKYGYLKASDNLDGMKTCELFCRLQYIARLASEVGATGDTCLLMISLLLNEENLITSDLFSIILDSWYFENVLDCKVQAFPKVSMIHEILNGLANDYGGAEKVHCILITRTKLAAYLLPKLITSMKYTSPSITSSANDNEVYFTSDSIVGKSNMSESSSGKVIEKFNAREINVLVSTSMIVEGVDISCCNAVIRYSGQYSGIESIQSQGRIRVFQGKYYVLNSNAIEKSGYVNSVTETAVHDEMMKKPMQLSL